MKEKIVTVWNNWYFQDGLVAVLIALTVWAVWTVTRNASWRHAFRTLFRRRLVTMSFVVLCMYASVALMDSVGYYQPLLDENNNVRFDSDTGKPLKDPQGISLLDVLLKRLKDSKEKTYSAPLATHRFTKETVATNGVAARLYPKLEHPNKHMLGTDRVGNDVLYLAIKGVRTGIIIGAFTTILVIPFALFFGVVAGYFGGWIDDIVQYIYTVIGSIPRILLIAAFMTLFKERGMTQLCIILGITSWTGLCRVLRGETLKLRETEYVQAGEAMGLSRMRIMCRHIVPNLMHLVLITAVLSFSGLVLSETVLTYLGMGVGADTISWGVMINDALGELARSPVIWWKLVAALIFMVGLVLPANLFGDALRDALDPRLKTE
jgi:ABC-type dipeptide/oligopeptide/nickel transport system permease subunit